jgi:hypothetical protein
MHLLKNKSNKKRVVAYDLTTTHKSLRNFQKETGIFNTKERNVKKLLLTIKFFIIVILFFIRLYCSLTLIT